MEVIVNQMMDYNVILSALKQEITQIHHCLKEFIAKVKTGSLATKIMDPTAFQIPDIIAQLRME